MAAGIYNRRQVLLQPRPHDFVALGQDKRLAQALHRLVDVEARAKGGDLEEHAAGLAEIDRPEVGAVDDWSRLDTGANQRGVPVPVVVIGRGPGYVVDAAGTLDG